MKKLNFAQWLGVSAVLLLAVAVWAVTSGTWRAFSEATGIGNPDAQITTVDVPDVSLPEFASAGADDELVAAARALPAAPPTEASTYDRDQFGPA